MVGFLLMSHGDLSKGIIDTCGCIIGHPDKTEYLTLAIEDDISVFEKNMNRIIDELDDGDGVLVMVDVLGGTPCNKASMQLKNKKIEIIAGINFPMVLAAYEARMQGKNLYEIKDHCLSWARKVIVSVREQLNL